MAIGDRGGGARGRTRISGMGYERPAPADVTHRLRGGAAAGYAAGGYEVSVPGQGAPRAAFVVNLPTVDKPPTATDFNTFGTAAGLTALNTPAELAAFQVPANSVGVIRSISILANALLTTSDIIWTLRFNGVAVSGWDALTINPRAASSVEVSWVPEETFILVPEGSRISFEATVRDGGTYQLSVGFHGWFFSTALMALAMRAYPQ